MTDQMDSTLRATLIRVLTNVAQVFDGWHQDGTAWSKWDESVRQDVSALLLIFGTKAVAVEASTIPNRQTVQKALAAVFGGSPQDAVAWGCVARAFDAAWPEATSAAPASPAPPKQDDGRCGWCGKPALCSSCDYKRREAERKGNEDYYGNIGR